MTFHSPAKPPLKFAGRWDLRSIPKYKPGQSFDKIINYGCVDGRIVAKY